jgi:GNAT superfamily N-acetyltransferase
MAGSEAPKTDRKRGEETARESLGENSWIFVTEDYARLVGFARVQLWDGAYFVREVFIEKPFRRQSAGSKMLAKCEDLVKRRGETSAYLSAEPKHSVSLKFLTKNGYDTLNMLELRKDFAHNDVTERQGEAVILGHKLRLLKRRE